MFKISIWIYQKGSQIKFGRLKKSSPSIVALINFQSFMNVLGLFFNYGRLCLMFQLKPHKLRTRPF